MITLKSLHKHDMMAAISGPTTVLLVWGKAAARQASASGWRLAPLSRRCVGSCSGRVALEPRDPWTYGVVAILAGLATLAACAVPAYRATRIDPLTTLRMD